jgi:hypothetical protein
MSSHARWRCQCVLLTWFCLIVAATRVKKSHEYLRGLMPALHPQPLELNSCLMAAEPPKNDNGGQLHSLTIVHTTFINNNELRNQAKMLELSAPSWLVTGALILAVNGPKKQHESELPEALHLYPHRRKMMCRLPNNGYECGQFADWHRLSAAWRDGQYAAVLFMESDVLATPQAILTYNSAIGSFRRHDLAAQGWFFEYFFNQSSFDMDFFALLPAVAKKEGREGVFFEAYHLCQRLITTNEVAFFGRSETAMARTVRATGEPVVVMLNRTNHGNRAIDAVGVWHAHDPKAVRTWLATRPTQEPRRTGSHLNLPPHLRGAASGSLPHLPTLHDQGQQAVDCADVVPEPIDASPIRSPQAMHTLLARKFSGLNVVEIGTRSGDGISCFAQAARQAIAIEANETYCDYLRARSATLPRAARFQVVCSFFDGKEGDATATLKTADVITWWMAGADNKGLLQVLQNLTELRSVPATAQAVILFDMHIHADRRSFASLLRFAAWNESVVFDECALCRARTKARTEDPFAVWESCNRAIGTFRAVGIMLGTLAKTSLTRLPRTKPRWDISLTRSFEEPNRCPMSSSPSVSRARPPEPQATPHEVSTAASRALSVV